MTDGEKASLLNGFNSAAYGDSHNGYYIGNIPAVPRLGIPSINMQDASQGFRTIDPSQYGQVTSWPCSLAVAGTWDVNLTEQWGIALGTEFRAKGANMILGPSLNVHRVAKGGRNAEYISGEDAYLGAQLVPAYVRGVQSQKVMANVKHYILNNQETNRDSVSSNVGERALQEIYMAPFRAGVLAGAASAMCSYNLINGTHSCSSDSAMNKALKEDLNFTGFVTSDWGAIHSDGCQRSGLDMDQPGTDHFFDPSKLTSDKVTLDDMAARVLTGLIMVDAFDNPVCTGGKDCNHYLYEANATSAEHADLARKIAATSASLLKNEGGVLPLRGNKTVAVVGDACDAPYGNLGSWNVGNYYVMGGSGRVINPASTSILTGLKARAAAASSGIRITSDTESADLIITCGASWSSEGADRQTLKVDQDSGIANVCASAKVPVVVLLTAPGAIVTASFDKEASAIVSMFLAGQATGLGWADVLFGDVNPSGKLPVTFPRAESDAVEPCGGSTCEYTEGLAVGYRGLWDKPVAFPFGHGLSYTTFKYELAGESAKNCAADAHACVHVRITNSGTVAGAEVAQLYLTYPDAAAEPSPTLKGFSKTTALAPGEAAVLTFNLEPIDLSIWDLELRAFTLMANSTFGVSIGSSSRDFRINTTIVA